MPPEDVPGPEEIAPRCVIARRIPPWPEALSSGSACRQMRPIAVTAFLLGVTVGHALPFR
jgi:hypothetical protein